MKYLIICLSTLISLSAYSQHPQIQNDTITYAGKKFSVGDTVHLAYGSGLNKNFAFIQTGSAMLGLSPLDQRHSKADVIINKVYKQSGKVYMRGKETEGHIAGYNIFIEVEGAVDNKELN